MKLSKLMAVIVLAGSWIWAGSAHALLEIHITGGTEGGIPIAIVPFQWAGSGPVPEDVSAIVSNDLRGSGRFELKPKSDFLETPHHGSEVNFEKWRAIGVDNLVVGRIQPTANGSYLVQFQLFDIYKPGALAPDRPAYKLKQLAGYNLPTPANRLRSTAHFISDVIYEALTGERGAFSTRIAYVTATGGAKDQRYRLMVADYDGHNEFEVVGSSQPLMSPTWSPDGRSLAYVSFEGGQPGIYVHDLRSAKARKVAGFRGINGAPAWSPDGRRLAMTLSRDDPGNPEIYVMDMGNNKLQQLTFNRAIDTEPVWMPDGESLMFTSDRSGGPQIYRVPASGGRAERVTFEGKYNARPEVSPDGKQMAMVHNDGSGFRIAVLNFDDRTLRIVTEGPLDESPTFAPNGSMILYATGHRERGELAAVSADGQVRQRLRLQRGDVREPSWGPFTDQSKETR